jgi:hypothetical protein
MGAQKGSPGGIPSRLVTSADIPMPDSSCSAKEVARPINAWRRQVLEANGLDPRWHWVALDGAIPVGHPI